MIYPRQAVCIIKDFVLGPYYNPMSKNDPYKRITLLPESITDEAKMTMKNLFGIKMDELNSREANDILVRTCPKENSTVTKVATRSSSTGSASGAKRYINISF